MSAARQRIAGTLWFRTCGRQDDETVDAVWLRTTSDGPGPEDKRCEALALLGHAHRDELVTDAPHSARTFAEIDQEVRVDAAKYPVGFSDAADAWHAATARVSEAAWWAALMAAYADSDMSMPPDVWEVWLCSKRGTGSLVSPTSTEANRPL